jgi:hypothetical protein
MTLNFLGCHYETTVTETEAPSTKMGMYRGNPVQISTGCVATRATKQLTYRGVTYTR